MLTEELGKELEFLGYTAVTANSVNNTQSDAAISKKCDTYPSQADFGKEKFIDCMTLNNIKQFLVYLSEFVRGNYKIKNFKMLLNVLIIHNFATKIIIWKNFCKL